jgi:phosphate uptake regulator
MVMDFFRGTADSGLDNVEAQLVQMLVDGRDVYEAAMSTVLGSHTPKEVKKKVKGADRDINQMQQEVRRELVVHASVHGFANLPSTLTYMSVVKDAERVGDYAKNIYDLAKYGADFRGAADQDELEHYRDVVSQLIQDAADVFSARDTAAAQKLIDKADGFLDEYDDHVKAAFHFEGPSSESVPRALYYRYLKRITAHLMNMMTALVMPIDRLDYYDEAKDDR